MFHTYVFMQHYVPYPVVHFEAKIMPKALLVSVTIFELFKVVFFMPAMHKVHRGMMDSL